MNIQLYFFSDFYNAAIQKLSDAAEASYYRKLEDGPDDYQTTFLPLSYALDKLSYFDYPDSSPLSNVNIKKRSDDQGSSKRAQDMSRLAMRILRKRSGQDSSRVAMRILKKRGKDSSRVAMRILKKRGSNAARVAMRVLKKRDDEPHHMTQMSRITRAPRILRNLPDSGDSVYEPFVDSKTATRIIDDDTEEANITAK